MTELSCNFLLVLSVKTAENRRVLLVAQCSGWLSRQDFDGNVITSTYIPSMIPKGRGNNCFTLGHYGLPATPNDIACTSLGPILLSLLLGQELADTQFVLQPNIADTGVKAQILFVVIKIIQDLTFFLTNNLYFVKISFCLSVSNLN